MPEMKHALRKVELIRVIQDTREGWFVLLEYEFIK
jgi:hypothetical protein